MKVTATRTITVDVSEWLEELDREGEIYTPFECIVKSDFDDITDMDEVVDTIKSAMSDSLNIDYRGWEGIAWTVTE